MVRKLFPLPRIGETVHQLGGFHYATALDLNMGYYKIRIYPASQDITTIVTEFGKFRYNRLPMFMFASGDILQSKVDNLLGYIKGVNTYICDILVLGKDSFKNKIYQVRIIFGRLCNAGLKSMRLSTVFG